MRKQWTRRSFADLYLFAVIVLGTGALVLFQPKWFTLPAELATLVLLFALAEYFLTRVRVGAVTFSFPVVYAAFMLYGIPGGMWTAALGTVIANLARRRAWRVTWFNSTQFALATLAAGHITRWLAGPITLSNLVWPLLTYITAYYTINNLIVDALLWLRLKVYHAREWWTKNRYEGLSAVVSLAYSLMMMALTPQQRGHDPLDLLFFFLPLLTVGGFVRLLTNLSRFAGHMATLMEVSSLATYSAESKALEEALSHLDTFDEYTFAAIYQIEGDELALRAVRAIPLEEVGHRRIPIGEGITGWVAHRGKAVITGDAKQDPRNTIGEGAREQVQSIAAFPLVSGGQVIGVFTVAKERRQSILPEDARLLTIFSNLLAAILRNQEFAQERERLVVVQERNRLAREIHDGLAQSLAGTLLQMDRLDRLVETEPKGARKLLAQLRDHVRELLLGVRRSIYDLRPSPLEEHGLVETLRQEVQRLKEKGTAVSAGLRLEVRGEQRRLSGLVEDEVFRIAQEGMMNALKHAEATEITLSLHFLADELRLMIRDNGKGFLLSEAVRGARDQKRFGLIGMSERAERLGANFEVDSRPGHGTRLMVDVELMGE